MFQFISLLSHFLKGHIGIFHIFHISDSYYHDGNPCWLVPVSLKAPADTINFAKNKKKNFTLSVSLQCFCTTELTVEMLSHYTCVGCQTHANLVAGKRVERAIQILEKNETLCSVTGPAETVCHMSKNCETWQNSADAAMPLNTQ